jgi:hypothetical protein
VMVQWSLCIMKGYKESLMTIGTSKEKAKRELKGLGLCPSFFYGEDLLRG